MSTQPFITQNGLSMNLTPGGVKDEACVLWPSRRLVDRLRCHIPFTSCPVLSLRKPEGLLNHHTRWFIFQYVKERNFKKL